MNGIFFVLKTGCQWNALNETDICSSSTAHRRFQEWTKLGVFKQLWEKGLTDYDERKGLQELDKVGGDVTFGHATAGLSARPACPRLAAPGDGPSSTADGS